MTAESPIKTIDKGAASTSVVAAIAVMKYADHLPLSCQATQIFKRSGIDFFVLLIDNKLAFADFLRYKFHNKIMRS